MYIPLHILDYVKNQYIQNKIKVNIYVVELTYGGKNSRFQ